MPKKSHLIIFLSAIVFLLQGCISLGQKIDTNKVDRIQKRVTTESQIRAWFGEPVTVTINRKRGVKILTYAYKNDDSIKKAAAGGAGAVAGGLLGSQIGGGSGSTISGSLAGNAVTARQEREYLEITIGLRSQTVIDFNYVEKNPGLRKSALANK